MAVWQQTHNSLGHGYRTHCLTSSDSSSHGWPKYSVGGDEQDLLRREVLFPQEELHADQEVQRLRPPETERGHWHFLRFM